MTPYDQLAYDSLCIPETHPERLCVLARLMGIQAADPGGCRVLELGAASGGNLIPMAAALPGARFLGIDLSAAQVAEGRALIETLGLANVALRTGDIAALDPDQDAELAGFDYVIAHGVYSWVAPEVAAALLRLARRALAPNGVLYVSWNVLPGWRMRGMLRDVLRDACRDALDIRQGVATARGALGRLTRGLTDLPGEAARYLRAEARELERAPDSYLAFEFLAEHNHPLCFRDFAAACDAAGLRYLCDSALHTGFPASLGEGAEAALADLEDGVDLEQWLDFLATRRFRQSLLVRDDQAGDEGLSLDRFAALAFSAELTAPSRPRLEGSKAVSFTRPDGEAVSVAHPLTKALLGDLAGRFPDALPLAQLLPAARERVARAGARAAAEELDALLAELFGLFARDAIRAHPVPRTIAGDPGGKPRASALARALVAGGRTQLPTRDHANLDLDPLAARLVALMDGTRDLEALLAGTQGALAPALARGSLERELRGRIALFRRYGLLDMG